MAAMAGHTIHKDHIHHGWNNAFTPCLRIAPGETIEFQTVDAAYEFYESAAVPAPAIAFD